jgi:nucleolar protein 56
MHLITRWFGTFVFDDKKLKSFLLFPNTSKELIPIIRSLYNGNVLPQEEELSSKSMIVFEKRLSSNGRYKPIDTFVDMEELLPEKYGFSYELLHQAMRYVCKEKIENELCKKDHQIVQMVKAVDELIQSANLLQERISYWNIYSPNSNNIEHFQEVHDHIQKEVDRLQTVIKDEMTLLARNLSNLIGPLLAARLLSIAGTMERLALLPASAVQILGAEKAFFRFKKEGGKPPKHGVIYQHQLINNSPRKFRGQIARLISLKIILAARADVITKRDISEDLINSLQMKINDLKKQNSYK